MEYEEAKQKIVDGLTKKQKVKSKFYFNDLAKILDEKPRAAKKLINQMVQEGVLEPVGGSREQWRFGVSSIRRVRTAVRLQRDLGVNLAGAALALELLDRIADIACG